MEAAGLLTFIELVGDYGAKVDNAVLAYGGYNVLAYTLMHALKTEPLFLVNAYWDAFSNLCTFALGMAMGETATTSQVIGVFLISAGAVLMSY